METGIKALATKNDLAKFKYDLSKAIDKAKGYTIKWMFIFWIVEISAILTVAAYLRK